jgi:tRNA (guanine37-N1)-methyltransferase
VRTISFISIHPNFVSSYFGFGTFGAASRSERVQFRSVNLRSFAEDRHGTVDGPPYGGGDGMILMATVLANATLKELDEVITPARVILPCPKGALFDQRTAQQWATSGQSLIFVCGRFAGVDQRYIDRYVTDRVSLGNYVISGGELAALAMADATLRLIPGVLGNTSSPVEDSFSGDYSGMLEYPVFTRPHQFEGVQVPEVLLSGDHQKIAAWRQTMAKLETERLRPDLRKEED